MKLASRKGRRRARGRATLVRCAKRASMRSIGCCAPLAVRCTCSGVTGGVPYELRTSLEMLCDGYSCRRRCAMCRRDQRDHGATL